MRYQTVLWNFPSHLQGNYSRQRTVDSPYSETARHVRARQVLVHVPHFSASRSGTSSVKKITGWKRPFDDPIPLPRGRQLVTLEDAARYIQKLPKAEQQLEEWQAAGGALLPGPGSTARPARAAALGGVGALRP